MKYTNPCSRLHILAGCLAVLLTPSGASAHAAPADAGGRGGREDATLAPRPPGAAPDAGFGSNGLFHLAAATPTADVRDGGRAQANPSIPLPMLACCLVALLVLSRASRGGRVREGGPGFRPTDPAGFDERRSRRFQPVIPACATPRRAATGMAVLGNVSGACGGYRAWCDTGPPTPVERVKSASAPAC